MAIFQSPKNIFQRPKFPGKSLKFWRKNDVLPNFRLPKFENSEPEKLQFHTPSRCIPPLDSPPTNCLCKVFLFGWVVFWAGGLPLIKCLSYRIVLSVLRLYIVLRSLFLFLYLFGALRSAAPFSPCMRACMAYTQDMRSVALDDEMSYHPSGSLNRLNAIRGI